MTAKNILITAIGSFSTQAVVNSLKKHPGTKIFGSDIHPKEWHYISNEFTEVFLAPFVKDSQSYMKFIMDTCAENEICTIIPLTDIEVDFFNEYREFFLSKKINITIGTRDFLSVARDKYKLHQLTEALRLPAIPTYHSDSVLDAQFPIVGKPRDGRSSEGLKFISDKNLFNACEYGDNYIFQERIDGCICTVDCLRDKMGNFFAVPRKELLRTKNGAGTTVELFHDDSLVDMCKLVCDHLGVLGCINIEFILAGGKYYLMDLNPRFSAGVGFSQLTGYDFVKNHVVVFDDGYIDKPITYKAFRGYKFMTDALTHL